MVQARQVEHVHDAARGTSAWIPCAKHRATHTRMHDGGGAHRTGLQCNVQSCVSQPVTAEDLPAGSKRLDFCMGRWIVRRDGPIGTLRNDFATSHEYSTNRHFPARFSEHCQVQRPLHEFNISPWARC